MATLFLFSSPCLAEGWDARLTTSSLTPTKILGVDKSAQTFYMLERKSPLRPRIIYPCTTGQAVGDKLRRGDLKTPEGVYFVTGKRTRGLDFSLYGKLAYTLNYPNPVDRLRGKTGSGIWIHGRGKPIVDRETKGCVALNNPDIKSLEGSFPIGTPAVIGHTLSWNDQDPGHEAAIEALSAKVTRWADDWRDKDEDFFGHYDEKAMNRLRSNGYAGFRRHKRKVFSTQPWIDVYVDRVQVLPGPDYWVTYFDQYYRTPSMTSQGVKRLYWQKGDDGEYRIVGREFVKSDRDLTGDYLKARTVDISRFLDSWQKAWGRADLPAYLGYYDPDAVQGARKGLDAIAVHKHQLWKTGTPKRIKFGGLDVSKHEHGLAARFIQEYEDSRGYTDRGVKTLVLAPAGDTWRIVSEDWRELR